ncbi:hypothetical protein Bbelb_334570 [Branchiostoma belcheri]|nr:hypothetical protein Bbelb_334570 [Branchiostoma belcheri]
MKNTSSKRRRHTVLVCSQEGQSSSLAKDYNLIEGEVIPNEKNNQVLGSLSLSPVSSRSLCSCGLLSSINRVTRAAKDAKHKRYKRLKQVKSFFLGHASVPGVGQTIWKMVMTKEEKQFAEEAEKAAAAFHGHGRGG